MSIGDDILGLNEATESTPLVSKADTVASLDLVRDDAKKARPHLIHSIAASLRKYVEAL